MTSSTDQPDTAAIACTGAYDCPGPHIEGCYASTAEGQDYARARFAPEQPTSVPPLVPSEDVRAALDSGDYCRVGRIAHNDPGQFCPRVKHPYEPELAPLCYWQNRAASMASALVAERVAAQVQAARAEVWREVIAALTTARSVSGVAVWAAGRLSQTTPADAAEVTA